jgi:chromosome segregation ATPase
MSTFDTGAEPRWWRRSRDLSLRALATAQAAAADAFFDVDSLHKDLPNLMKAHEEVRKSAAGRGTTPDPAGRDWQTLSDRVDAVIENYLALDGSYSRDRDYEEVEANRLAESFGAITRDLMALKQPLAGFRDRHGAALEGARNQVLQAPRLIETSTTVLRETLAELDRVQAAGLTDPGVVASCREAHTLLEAAKASAERREWLTASREAERAAAIAKDARQRVAAIPEQAKKAREGFTSVRTRREALQTQHDRLGPVMSDLRRRYSYGSWKHIDDAPKRIDTALAIVESGLTELETALKVEPLNVPAATDLLRKVRSAASDVDTILREAQTTVRELDEVSKDPQALVSRVQVKSRDARRFLMGLPKEKADRYAYTFDNLAARTERLAQALRQSNPDWGHAIAEAKSIEIGLDAMVQTARTS